jgi:2-dehydro-3-deoxyphosphogluconate aldolase/(4S)-4-hydroxy-2-oxoglutarate aldolase
MLEQLKITPLVPVFFHPDGMHAQQVLQACYAGGVRFFEFTNRGKEAPEVFINLKKFAEKNCPGLSLGIGTIYTADAAELFLKAGADFIVQPVTTGEVGVVCRMYEKPWIPGAMTPNEIWSAWQMGATAVKIFPGNLVGPDYIRALRGPMPHIPLMVTGGVEPTVGSVRQWLDAGVQVVGIGSQLFKDASSDFKALEARIAGILNNLLSA